MANIYVSFSKQDAVFMKLLVKQFAQDNTINLVYTIGRLTGEAPWDDNTDAQIAACDLMLIICSPQARASDYATYEWATASSQNKPLIALQLRAGTVHPKLRTIPAIDFTAGPAWDALANIIRDAVAPPSMTPQITGETTDSMDAAAPISSDVPTLPPNTPTTIREAYEGLESFEPSVRATAIETLTNSDHPAAGNALALAMQHPEREIRWIAVKALAAKDDERALPGLLEMMSSRNEQDTWDAAWSMVRIGGTDVVEGILSEMRKNSTVAIRSGTWALGQMVRDIKPQMLDIMADDDTNIRLASVEILSEIGTEILPEIVEMLGSHDEFRRDTAVRILRNFEADAIPLLIQALSQDGELRRTAGRTLIAIGDPAVRQVADELRSNDLRMVKAAEQILRNINSQYSQKELVYWQDEQKGT